MFKNLNDFKDNLRTLINLETTTLPNLTPKDIKNLELEFEIDITNFVDSLIKSSRLINALSYMNKQHNL